MSPPPEDRGPPHVLETPSCYYSTNTASIESVANHFDGMALSENYGLASCSDCVVCGKSVQQTQGDAVNDYLDKTVVPGETLAETERRKRAFPDGTSAGTFLLMPVRVSQVYSRLRLLHCSTRNNSSRLRKDQQSGPEGQNKQEQNFFTMKLSFTVFLSNQVTIFI